MTILDIQDQIQTLLEAEAYFSGVAVISERVGTLETTIAKAIQTHGFYISIRNAGGEQRAPEMGIGMMREVFEVTLAQNPITDASRATRNVVDGVVVAMTALLRQKPGAGEDNAFRVTRHQGAYTDKGLAIQIFEVQVDIQLALPVTP